MRITIMSKEKNKQTVQDRYRKNLSVLTAIAFFLAIFFVIGTIVQRGQRSNNLGGIDQFISKNADIRRVIIGAEEEIYLDAVNDLWTVSDDDGSVNLARQERIEDFIDSILSIQFTRRVSKEADDLAVYGFQNTVDFLDGENRRISRLYFGNIATQSDEQYFRLEDNPSVYAIDTSLRFFLEQSYLYWIDLRLWEELDGEPVVFYRSYADGRREEWRRNEDGDWLSVDGNEAPAEVESASRALSRLEGENIVPALPDETQYLLTSGIETDAGRRLEIMIYSKQEGDDSSPVYYLSQSAEAALRSPDGNLRTYILPEWRYEVITGF